MAIIFNITLDQERNYVASTWRDQLTTFVFGKFHLNTVSLNNKKEGVVDQNLETLTLKMQDLLRALQRTTTEECLFDVLNRSPIYGERVGIRHAKSCFYTAVIQFRTHTNPMDVDIFTIVSPRIRRDKNVTKQPFKLRESNKVVVSKNIKRIAEVFAKLRPFYDRELVEVLVSLAKPDIKSIGNHYEAELTAVRKECFGYDILSSNKENLAAVVSMIDAAQKGETFNKHALPQPLQEAYSNYVGRAEDLVSGSTAAQKQGRMTPINIVVTPSNQAIYIVLPQHKALKFDIEGTGIPIEIKQKLATLHMASTSGLAQIGSFRYIAGVAGKHEENSNVFVENQFVFVSDECLADLMARTAVW